MSFDSLLVDSYMTRLVLSVEPSTPLTDVEALLRERGISSVPVVDGDKRILGVVSLTDLVRAQVFPGQGPSGWPNKGTSQDVAQPPRVAADVMEKRVFSVTRGESIAQAAKGIAERTVHRAYVVDEPEGVLVGVLSTRDIMRAVWTQRIMTPLRAVMSSPVVAIDVRTPVAQAIERLDKANVRGLVVVDGSWPLGAFTQIEALAARDKAPTTPVEEVMSYEAITLEEETPVFRAAAYGVSMGVRRILVVENGALRGIATGIDIVRVAAGLA